MLVITTYYKTPAIVRHRQVHPTPAVQDLSASGICNECRPWLRAVFPEPGSRLSVEPALDTCMHRGQFPGYPIDEDADAW